MRTTGIGKELAINIQEAVINLQQIVTELNISENVLYKIWSFDYYHHNYDDENLLQCCCTFYPLISHIKEQIQLSLDKLHEVTLCILKENRKDLYYPYITEFLADIAGYNSRQNQYFNWPIIQMINDDFVIRYLVREFIYQFEIRFFDTVLSGELGKIIDEIKNTISPKRQETPPQLPPKLSTPEAMVYWKKAQKAGLVDDNYKFVEGITQQSKVYFIHRLCTMLGHGNMWAGLKPFTGMENQQMADVFSKIPYESNPDNKIFNYVDTINKLFDY